MSNSFRQLCVWEHCILGDKTSKEFESFMASKEGFEVRVKFAEEVKRLPDVKSEDSATDLFFWVHEDDVSKFAVPRIQVGIRWWKDVLGNNQGYRYSNEVQSRYPNTWDD